MTIPVWPSQLPPCPLLDGFERQPQAPFERTEMDNGLARHRRRFRVFPVTIPVQFVLTRAQYDVYTAFCVDTLNGWADWFMVNIDGPGGVALKRVRWFRPIPTEARIGADHWRITGQLETLSNF